MNKTLQNLTSEQLHKLWSTAYDFYQLTKEPVAQQTMDAVWDEFVARRTAKQAH
jgi:hypothetical protein